MTGSIEGRWLIDFGNDGPAGPASNEVVLGNGIVAFAVNGNPVGRYDPKPGELTITLPMPLKAGHAEWQMILRFALPQNLGAQSDLIGVMHGVGPDAEAIAHPCMLRRRHAQA